MTDIYETIDKYECVCKEDKIQPDQYIMAMFDREKDECIFDRHVSMHLHLAGNNHLLTKRRFTDTDMTILYKTLRTNSYVVSLDLRYNNIGNEGVKVLAQLIEDDMALQSLNIMNNDFDEEGAMYLAKALTKNESLRTLRINGNKIGNKGGMQFAAALQVNTALEGLDLAETDQKTECVIAMATVLNYNNTLKALNVSRPLLFSHQEETTVHFAKMLKVNRCLKELHLMKQDIRDFGAARLSENLVHNYHLSYLNLSCNRITMDGAKELAKFLQQDTPLKILDLGYNRIGDDGALHLAEVLGTMNTNLNTLVLTSNRICGKGLCAIADSMKFNSSLNAVYIWGNNLEESACIAFSNLIESGRLELQNSDVKPYVVDGITKLAELSHGIRRWYYWGPDPSKDQLYAPGPNEYVAA